MDLYRKYRPTDFDQVRGQKGAVKTLTAALKAETVPHAYLFSGPSGCGKSTLAYIMADKLGCVDGDFQEVDCAATENALSAVREVKVQMFLSPGFGKTRVWLFEEVQSLSRAKFAQEAMLKMLEQCPDHVYFMLATTNPAKIIEPVRSRCTVVPVKKLSDEAVRAELKTIAKKAEVGLQESVLNLLIDRCGGNMRAAINCLQKVACLDDEDDQLDCIKDELSDEADAFRIVKILFWDRKNKQDRWRRIVGVINSLGEQNWEGLRQLVLKVATGQMLKDFRTAGQSYRILTCFQDNWYDRGKSGLLTACWESVFNDD